MPNKRIDDCEVKKLKELFTMMTLKNDMSHDTLDTLPADNYLLGKVALLVVRDTAVSYSLSAQLAEKGADIVLYCDDLSVEMAQRLRERVESAGRLFILLQNENEVGNERFHTTPQMIQSVTNQLGQLDLFIDLTSPLQKKPTRSVVNGTNDERRPEQFFGPALRAIVHS